MTTHSFLISTIIPWAGINHTTGKVTIQSLLGLIRDESALIAFKTTSLSRNAATLSELTRTVNPVLLWPLKNRQNKDLTGKW